MLPASNRGAGQNIGFPDVCLTPAPPAPPVPVPYPNIGMNAQALGFSPIVKVSMVNALNMGSTISMTSGDEAGAAHPTIKGQGKWTMGNPIVSRSVTTCTARPSTAENVVRSAACRRTISFRLRSSAAGSKANCILIAASML